MSGLSGNLRFVVFPEGDSWIAQGLEHDICAQGGDVNALVDRVSETVKAEIDYAREHGRTLADIPPAPAHFFQMWNERTGFSVTLGENSDAHVELALCA